MLAIKANTGWTDNAVEAPEPICDKSITMSFATMYFLWTPKAFFILKSCYYEQKIKVWLKLTNKIKLIQYIPFRSET